MCAFITTIANLSPASITATIKVRCVRAYKVSYNGREKDIMSLECVVHDRNGVKIHVSFPKKVVHKLGLKMEESHIYVIKNFLVRPNHMRMKTTPNQFRINAYVKTEVCEVFEADFPINMFSFKTFPEVAAIANLNEEPLFDIIGVIKRQGPVVNEKNGKLIELELEDELHQTVYCTLWEDHVDSYLKQTDSKQKKIPIVVIQFCRPSLFKGTIHTNTSYNCSKVSLNKDIPAINEFRNRIFGDESFINSIPTVVAVAPKMKAKDELDSNDLQLKNIQDLFCLEDGMYWICARIEGVNCFEDWFYLSCIRCSKKVSKDAGKFYCDRCKKHDGSATQRFMLKLDLYDGSCSSEFILWDRDCAALLGKKAGEINCEAGQVGVPNEIEMVLNGQILLFKVLLRTEKEFSENQAYNINMICSDPDIVSKYSGGMLDRIDSALKKMQEEKSFYDECESLSQITDLGSVADNLKFGGCISGTPKAAKIGFSSLDNWFDEADEQKTAVDSSYLKPVEVKGSKSVIDLDE